ncbi:MAG: hypothetical protein ACRDYY_11510 [Acidimicrobiales bacterium]
MSTGDSIEGPATALADAIDVALPRWVTGCVERVMSGRSGGAPAAVAEAARAAGDDARSQVGAEVRRLLLSDIDQQRTTPLALLRGAVRYPTAVLHQAGVPPVERDRFSREAFPDDPYDLSPASWADIDPGLVELGITWGAAKAFEHQHRHRQGR